MKLVEGGASLEVEPCPDEIDGWTRQDASPAVRAHLWDNRIQDLILDAGGDIVPGQDDQKLFQFMFT